jgi:hypothetical protein
VSELTRVEVGLNSFVNYSITDTQSVEVEGYSWNSAVADLLVVLIEQIVEPGPVVLSKKNDRSERVERDICMESLTPP